MLQPFGRVLTTISRRLIDKCRYMDSTQDERCPVCFRACGVVPVIPSRRATLGSADDPVRIEKEKQDAGVSEIISKTRRRTSARHRNRRFSKQNQERMHDCKAWPCNCSLRGISFE